MLSLREAVRAEQLIEPVLRRRSRIDRGQHVLRRAAELQIGQKPADEDITGGIPFALAGMRF
jgi:hypothetical protein